MHRLQRPSGAPYPLSNEDQDPILVRRVRGTATSVDEIPPVDRSMLKGQRARAASNHRPPYVREVIDGEIEADETARMRSLRNKESSRNTVLSEDNRSHFTEETIEFERSPTRTADRHVAFRRTDSFAPLEKMDGTRDMRWHHEDIETIDPSRYDRSDGSYTL